MSNDTQIREQIRRLTVATCIFIAIRDWRSQHGASREWLVRGGIANPAASEVTLFSRLAFRKAITGFLVAVLLGALCIFLLHWWNLPPFR